MRESVFSGTALITGSSSGLGESFARLLAARGCSVILVARREDRLRALALDIETRSGVRAEVWPADLSGDAGIISVEERLRGRTDVGVLINNAGFGAGGLFPQTKIAKQAEMIHVHILATARLTHAVLGPMIEKKRGVVINVASVAAFSVLPDRLMYGTTKAWEVAFARGLAVELPATGVRFLAVCPGFTYTEFHDTPEFADFKRTSIPKFLWMQADDVVERTLRAAERRKTVFIPGGWNKILAMISRLPFSSGLAKRAARKRRSVAASADSPKN